MKLLLYSKFLFIEDGNISLLMINEISEDLTQAKYVSIAVKQEEPGFRQFYGHDCLSKGYVPGEAASFIKFCITCGQYYDSITELIFHNLTIHKHLPKVGCVILGCGRSYFNNHCQ